MHTEDFKEFASLLDATWELNPRWSPLSAQGKALFFKALAHQSLVNVRHGLTAHIQDPERGRFQPMPADVLAQLERASNADSRPGAEEAWAICLPAKDEMETVVWTEEMGAAFQTCRPILMRGDEVGARMAFKEAYIRLVEEARRAGRLVKWTVSQGQDKTRRAAVIEHAVATGRLPAPAVTALLPAPTDEKPDRAGLERLKQELAKLQSPEDKAAMQREAMREAEAARKNGVAKRVQEYANERGIQILTDRQMPALRRRVTG